MLLLLPWRWCQIQEVAADRDAKSEFSALCDPNKSTKTKEKAAELTSFHSKTFGCQSCMQNNRHHPEETPSEPEEQFLHGNDNMKPNKTLIAVYQARLGVGDVMAY